MQDVPVESATVHEPLVMVDPMVPFRAPATSAPSINTIQLPREGQSLIVWTKYLERRFNIPVESEMIAEAESYGWPVLWFFWNPEITRKICLSAVARIMDTPRYNGEFDHLANEIAEHRAWLEASRQPLAGDTLERLRKLLACRIQAEAHFLTARCPSIPQAKARFQEVAALCQTGQGYTGQVPESLQTVNDVTWIINMIAYIENGLREKVRMPNTEEFDVCI
jgi:hypothetical protein